MAMSSLETVYVIHNFEAENEDELSLNIGEPIFVIQKDDEFNDGWWKGRNSRGQVGIFPINYIDQYSHQIMELPTPSNSDSYNKKPSHINTSLFKDKDMFSNKSSYSINSVPTPACDSPVANNALRKTVANALFLPNLRSTQPRDWDVYQVESWLEAMGFGSISMNFRAQEITGDILLELTMESLKELNISTFGKRFKMYSAILALREECGLQAPINGRMSIITSNYPDDFQSKSPTTPPASARSSNPMYGKNSASYHSNLTANDKFFGRKSYHNMIVEDYEENQTMSPITNSPQDISPITPSNYDIIEANKYNYEMFQHESKLLDSSSRRDINYLQQSQTHQTILPMAVAPVVENTNAAPDMEGWLYKQGSKYKKWNKRWFVLKTSNLFYFKSPKDTRMKGIINLRGYRIIPDASIQPGKYSFKAQHEGERTFYFYTDIDTNMKAWISNLMKATISRDFTAPVLSSSMISTVSLDEARRMRPRPPSVILYKKDTATSNHNTYDFNNGLMSENNSSLITTTDRTSSTADSLQEESDSDRRSSEYRQDDIEEEDEREEDDYTEEEEQSTKDILNHDAPWTASDYIEWINTISGSAEIKSLSELRQGDVLIEILEELSGKTVRQSPPSTVVSVSMLSLDNIGAAFTFMNRQGIVIGNKYTIKDIYNGKEDKIILMLESILKWSISAYDNQDVDY